MDKNVFYVYVYLNPLIKGKFEYDNIKFDYEPFYVGKGKNNRYKYHLYDKKLKTKNSKNKLINEIKINNLQPLVLKIYENLNEIDAYEKEKEIIGKIGCIIYNNGPLTNLTRGGDGIYSAIISEKTRKKCSVAGKRNGRKGKTNVEYFGLEKANELKRKNSLNKKGKTYDILYGYEKSKIIRNKQSKSQKGVKKITEEGKQILREYHKNKNVSIETRNKITKSLIGNKRNLNKKHTQKTKNKISISKKGSIPHNKYKIIQYDKNMIFIKEWESATDASDKLKISQGNITLVVLGKRKTCSGYIWKKK